MEKVILKLALILTVVSVLLSCEKNEETVLPIKTEDNPTPTISLPSKKNNFWTYNVVTLATSTAPETTKRDSIYVGNDTLINSITYKRFKTKTLPNGFYAGSVRNNGVRIDGSKLKITGALAINVGLPTLLNFDINDFIFLKEDAPSNEELSTITGSFNQTIPQQPNTPLKFEYVMKSIADGILPSFTSNGVVYTNVNKTKIVLNLKITSSVSPGGGLPPVTLTLMSAQDVLVSTLHFSKNKGMVYNKSVVNYSINTSLASSLNIPATGTQTQEEFLKTFLIN